MTLTRRHVARRRRPRVFSLSGVALFGPRDQRRRRHPAEAAERPRVLAAGRRTSPSPTASSAPTIFISNETTFQEVDSGAAEARRRPTACTSASGPIRTSPTSRRSQPRMAFIIDIRAAEHARAPDVQGAHRDVRATAPTSCRGCSRGRGRPASTASTPQDAVRRLHATRAGARRCSRRTCRTILDRLVKRHGFTLTRRRPRAASSTSTARSSRRARTCATRSRASSSARAGFRPTPS